MIQTLTKKSSQNNGTKIRFKIVQKIVVLESNVMSYLSKTDLDQEQNILVWSKQFWTGPKMISQYWILPFDPCLKFFDTVQIFFWNGQLCEFLMLIYYAGVQNLLTIPQNGKILVYSILKRTELSMLVRYENWKKESFI